ncbi:MAG: BTAD domain-containing putative transcriptional regulator [Ilumatobacteraceae bacterium]
MRFGVLGPLQVTNEDGSAVDLGGRQPRIVLATLIAAGGRPVSVDALIEAVWPDRPPASAAGTLQSYISRLRRTLGADLVLDHAGYRLDLAAHSVDLQRFEELATAGQVELTDGRPVAARRALSAALALWRGPALVDLVDQGVALGQAATIDEQRMSVLEARIDADLALGRHTQVVAELQVLAAEHPLREGLHARLALALYRGGRQAEALRALADASRMLRDEIGLEPGRALRELEQGILDHDPSLDPPEPVAVRPDDQVGSPFVGRQRELDEMLAAYAQAADDAQFIVVEGDPGIGKSRLAEEFAAAASGRESLTVWARANELGATQALWPWLEALRAVVPFVDEAPPLLNDLLTGDAAPAGRGGASQFERFDAFASLFERAGAVAPLVILLDDLQWCDPASLELLQFLVTRLRRGVVVVVTVRTLEIGRRDEVTDALGAIARRPGVRRLRLDGLSRAATGQLLAALSQEPVGHELPDRIHDRAEGNPFYTLELARLLDEPGGVEGEVPATVRDAVRRRLGLLPQATVDLLSVAAVVGRDVDLLTVAAVAGIELGECVDRLDPAAECRILVADPAAATALRFSHALVREVLVDDLTPLRRAQLHLHVADAMEQTGVGNDDIALLADHLWQAAALGVGERAAAALERAAEVAVGRAAYKSAEMLIRRAVQLREGAGTSTQAQESLLRAQVRLLEVMQATRYFSGTDRDLLHSTQDLAARLGHDGVSRELTWSEWAAVSRRADVAEAKAIAERYVARWSDDPSPHVRASAAIVEGVTAWSQGRMPDAIADLDRAVSLLHDAPPPSSPLEREQPLIAESFRRYCHAAHGTMSPEDALAGFDELLDALPPKAVDGRHQLVLALACRVAAVHLRWDALDALVARALELDPAAEFEFFGGQLLLYRALVEARCGELDAALATFADGRARYRAVGGRTGLPTCQALLAEQLVAGGRVADAAELTVGARQQIVETGEAVNEVPVCIAEGVVAAAAGDTTRAVERLTAAVTAGDRQGAYALARRAEAVAADLDIDVAAGVAGQ